jgi:hypothetical protein
VPTLRRTLEKAKSPTVIKPVPRVTEEMVEYGVPVPAYVKAEIPMVVTLFGIVIEDKNFVESRKAFSPIFTIPSFNVSEVKASRPWKALTGIEVTVPGIVREVSFFA